MVKAIQILSNLTKNLDSPQSYIIWQDLFYMWRKPSLRSMVNYIRQNDVIRPSVGSFNQKRSRITKLKSVFDRYPGEWNQCK